MKLIILILTVLGACQDNRVDKESDCSTEATVKKLQLDGCDFVFQLKNGTYLIPERRVYVQAPSQSEDPIYYYTFVDGAKVKINYQISTGLTTACMAGDIVFITCITALESSGQ